MQSAKATIAGGGGIATGAAEETETETTEPPFSVAAQPSFSNEGPDGTVHLFCPTPDGALLVYDRQAETFVSTLSKQVSEHGVATISNQKANTRKHDVVLATCGGRCVPGGALFLSLFARL